MRATQGAQGQRRRRDQGRRPRGPDRGGDGAAGRAAVRGPDQGDPRHPGRAQRRTQGGVGGAEEVPHLHQAGREGPGQAGHGEGRRRVQDPDRRPPAQGDPAPQERPGVLGAAVQAAPTAARPTTSAPSCSSSRATPRSAPPSWPATPSSRRCCRSAARSSTSRRPRSATCSRTPSAPRSSRSSAPARAAPSTSRPARYGRIIFMADADSDGAHIRCLLATLFFKYMPELITRGPGLLRRPAAAPDRAVQPQEGDGQVRLHLLRRRAAAEAGRADEEGRALEGPGAALQGPRRDGRRPAGRDHHGPAPPHPAPDHRRRRRRGRRRSSSC